MPPINDKDITEVKENKTQIENFSKFKEKYEAHINMIAEKRRQEEEQKKKEQELFEEQQRKTEMEAEESKAEEEKKKENVEAKEGISIEEPKPEDENPELNLEPNEDIANIGEAQPIVESLLDPIELPKPELVPIDKKLIFDIKLPQGHSIVLKSTNSISATELMLLPLVYNENQDTYFYKDFISVKPRQIPHRYFIKEDEEEPNIIELDQIPTHIQSYFTSIYNPLQLEDWEAWLNIISKLNAIGYLLIPPMDTIWPYKVDACVLHLLSLPNEGMHGFDELRVPIDSIIMSIADYEKKTVEDKGEFILFTLRMIANN